MTDEEIIATVRSDLKKSVDGFGLTIPDDICLEIGCSLILTRYIYRPDPALEELEKILVSRKLFIHRRVAGGYDTGVRHLSPHTVFHGCREGLGLGRRRHGVIHTDPVRNTEIHSVFEDNCSIISRKVSVDCSSVPAKKVQITFTGTATEVYSSLRIFGHERGLYLTR